eukprot:10275753-Alexandrium_andersonii.AAC.1
MPSPEPPPGLGARGDRPRSGHAVRPRLLPRVWVHRWELFRKKARRAPRGARRLGRGAWSATQTSARHPP